MIEIAWSKALVYAKETFDESGYRDFIKYDRNRFINGAEWGSDKALMILSSSYDSQYLCESWLEEGDYENLLQTLQYKKQQNDKWSSGKKNFYGDRLGEPSRVFYMEFDHDIVEEVSFTEALEILQTWALYSPYFREPLISHELIDHAGGLLDATLMWSYSQNLQDDLLDKIHQLKDLYGRCTRLTVWNDFVEWSFGWMVERYNQRTREWKRILVGGLIYWKQDRYWSIHT